MLKKYYTILKRITELMSREKRYRARPKLGVSNHRDNRKMGVEESEERYEGRKRVKWVPGEAKKNVKLR